MKGLWLASVAAATRMVPLPQLPAQSEDLEQWLHNNIHPTRANDGWAAYQRQVLDWCAPFWRPEIVSDYDVLLDRDLWETWSCLLYTSPSPRDATLSRMPSSA